jgi:ATP-dependent Clp protease ATP-binding subunit ClpA
LAQSWATPTRQDLEMSNMFRSLNDQARRALKASEELAHGMNHDYVGTEHILLGLIQDEQGLVARALDELGADQSRIRREIEQLVVAGADPVAQSSLPLTPRAKRAISFAEEHLWILRQDRVGPEHLVFGLLREPDGVAGQVLRNLGVDLHQLGKRVFEPRLNQLRFVERVVRPVRASARRKRKLREELLGHLTAMCDEEQERFDDPAAALQAATERFGIPANLTHEIEASLPASERFNYFVERRLGWRAPESTGRWMLRLSA